MSEYAGNRWYKCDLHLHTMTSSCYLDKENTSQDWVQRALEQGLSAVAVTDHNDYRGISGIMEEGKKQGLAVFPGVEITCDSSKIHIVILFDTNKHAETVRDFLNRCDIDSDHIGDTEGTSLSVFEVCEIAKKRGALVIAAHIDEFNSISGMNPANIDRLFEGGYIDAVQVSNVPVWRKFEEDKNSEAMQKVLEEKYGPDATPQETERWRKCYNRAKAAGLPMLAFSDNPRSEGESKHGLWGIGSVYTWIQMDDVVNLESIRQSLFAPESRIRMIYDSEAMPHTEPDFWIRSLEVRKTELNPHAPIHLDFHPQLNCIIGGKGSGKSALVRILSGVYSQFSGSLLKGTVAQQMDFYTRVSEENRGIFHEDSEIEIRFSWYGTPYKMLVTDIQSITEQKTAIYRIDPETGEETEEDWTDLLSSPGFYAEVLTQRQIHEIAVTPGALLNYTDRTIEDMHLQKMRKQYYFGELINLSTEIRAGEDLLENDGRVRAELEWYRKRSEEEPENPRIKEWIRTREQLLGMLEPGLERMEELRSRREELMKEYDRCFEEIRRMRTEFIDSALEEDGNYKMELQPSSSHESLRSMLKELLSDDVTLTALLSEDLRKLETALFSKGDGLNRYTDLLLLARKGMNGRQQGAADGAEKFMAYFAHYIRNMKEADFERMLLFRPEDEICMYYHPNGVKKLYPMTNASAGEKATAVFSFILASGSTPLIIDQPEDDMDNRVIYEEVVSKMKRAKQRRQIIVVTHNANIALNTDPEMIISMDSHSKFTKVRMQGSADNDDVRREVCDVVEGSEKAFLQRARKYHLQQD